MKSNKSQTERWQARCESVPWTTGTLFSSSLSLKFSVFCVCDAAFASNFCQSAGRGPRVGPGRDRGQGFSIRLHMMEPNELVHQSKNSMHAACCSSGWRLMRLICIFSLPYISSRTVTCPRLSHSTIIHPVSVLILSKDISDAERTDANLETDDINTKQYLDRTMERWPTGEDGPRLWGRNTATAASSYHAALCRWTLFQICS